MEGKNKADVSAYTDASKTDPQDGSKTVRYAPGQAPGSIATRFQPGNPYGAGRPKQTQEQKDALAMLRAAAPTAIKTLLEVMESKKARGADRLKAAEMVIQYTYGKAPQTVTVTAGNAVADEIARELAAIRGDFARQIREQEKLDPVPEGAPTLPPELE